MKAQELRIGNLIYNNGVRIIDAHDIMICDRNSDSFNNRNSPIPLTEDWLLKCGLRSKKKKLRGGYIKFTLLNNLFIETERNFVLMKPWIIISRCEYVHQLQNLYFALTGEELIINYPSKS